MRIRTADPLLAKQVLYQLSYTPKVRFDRLFTGSLKIIPSKSRLVKCFNAFFTHTYKKITRSYVLLHFITDLSTQRIGKIECFFRYYVTLTALFLFYLGLDTAAYLG